MTVSQLLKKGNSEISFNELLQGENTPEIEVANFRFNRLAGDQRFP